MRDKPGVQICIPVCERSFAAMRAAAIRAARHGELVELRLDYLDSNEFRDGRNKIDSLLTELDRPTIITWRPEEQGGHRALDRAERIAFWLFGKPGIATFLDIEMDLASSFASDDGSNRFCDWSRIICSHHDFLGVPAHLNQIYERMAETPARILKIAVSVADASDCIPVFHLLERARKEGREIIAIAMGTAGIATRILGPSRGAFLTYGALELDSTSAPGQLTAAELKDQYHIDSIDLQTQITGLVGQPVSHSVSPQIHNAAFAAAGVNAVYIPLDVRDIESFMVRMIHPRTRKLDWNLRGLSVTSPHKSTVMAYLDWIEPAAREIGAVNTIVAEQDELHGYNTDCAAFVATLSQELSDLRGARCAVIGGGGASRSVLAGLQQQGAEVTLFARDVERGTPLAQSFGAACRQLNGSQFHEFDVVINATPLGTHGMLVDETPVAAAELRGAGLAYDLVYNPLETRFLREAKEAGCKTLGGLAMLISQAAEQFKLWTGVDAPRDVMLNAASRAFSNA
jgi:3-dehydroquinate dehydratase/shikimate dehydrogenase